MAHRLPLGLMPALPLPPEVPVELDEALEPVADPVEETGAEEVHADQLVVAEAALLDEVLGSHADQVSELEVGSGVGITVIVV